MMLHLLISLMAASAANETSIAYHESPSTVYAPQGFRFSTIWTAEQDRIAGFPLQAHRERPHMGRCPLSQGVESLALHTVCHVTPLAPWLQAHPLRPLPKVLPLAQMATTPMRLAHHRTRIRLLSSLLSLGHQVCSHHHKPRVGRVLWANLPTLSQPSLSKPPWIFNQAVLQNMSAFALRAL